MPIHNSNLLQENIDFELLSKLNDKYLLDSLANLGQRQGIRGSGVTYNNLYIENTFLIHDGYFVFEYTKNDISNIKAKLSTYNSTNGTITELEIDESTNQYKNLNIDSTIIYNKFILDKITIDNLFGLKLFNDIKEYIPSISSASYETLTYNTESNIINEYNRLMYLYNDNNENIYILINIKGNKFNYVLFKDPKQKYNGLLINDKLDYQNIIDQLLSNSYYSIIYSSLDIENPSEYIIIDFDTEKNKYYSLSNNVTMERCNLLLTYIGLNVSKLLGYLNNDLRYLIPNIINHLSNELFTKNINLFCFRLFCKLYETILESQGINKSNLANDNGKLFIPYNTVITYLCSDNNLFSPFISKNISVEYVNNISHIIDNNIYYLYSNENKNILKENKIVDFYFSGYYNNDYLLNINFYYNVNPYIGEDNLWHINDKQTDISADVNNKYFLDLILFEQNSNIAEDNLGNLNITDNIDKYITCSHEDITIIELEYKSFFDNKLHYTINIPYIKFQVKNNKHNYAIICKIEKNSNILYIIYNTEYNNDSTFTCYPIIINNSVLLIDDLFNAHTSANEYLISFIENTGFNELLNIKNKFYILLDSLISESYDYITLARDKNKDNVVYNYIPHTSTNNVEIESDFVVNEKTSNIENIKSNKISIISNSDESVSSSYAFNDNKSQKLVISEETLSSPLLEIQEYLLHNIKLLNKLGIISFDKDNNKYLDYIGINRYNNRSNEIIFEPIRSLYTYLLKEVDEKNLNYKLHDTIRFNYDNIINDGITWKSLINRDTIKASLYYSYSYKLSGYYYAHDFGTILKNETNFGIEDNNSNERLKPLIEIHSIDINDNNTNDNINILTDTNNNIYDDSFYINTQENSQDINKNDVIANYPQFILNVHSEQLILNISNIINYLSINENSFSIYFNGEKIFNSSLNSDNTVGNYSGDYFYIIDGFNEYKYGLYASYLSGLNYIISNIRVDVLKEETLDDKNNINLKYKVFINCQ